MREAKRAPPAQAGELERLREAIDRVDDRILEALNERAKLARAIGTLKVGQAYRPEREAQVLKRVQEKNPGPLACETVALLFREVMSACLALERPITVAYLGPRGTFSERAAVQLNVNNITNERYVERGYTGHFTPGPTRSVLLSFDYRY